MTFVTCDIAMPIHQSPTPNCPVVTLSSLAIRNRCSPETIATTAPPLAQPSPGQARHPGRAADRAAQQCAILSSRVRGRIFQRLACRVGGDAGMAANHGFEKTSMQDRYVWQSCLRKPASKAGCMAALADCWGPREPFAHTLGSLPRLGWVFRQLLGVWYWTRLDDRFLANGILCDGRQSLLLALGRSMREAIVHVEASRG